MVSFELAERSLTSCLLAGLPALLIDHTLEWISIFGNAVLDTVWDEQVGGPTAPTSHQIRLKRLLVTV